MTRILSGLLLVLLVVGVVWFLPPGATLALAMAVSVLAVFEFAAMAAGLQVRVPRAFTAVATAAACAAVGVGVALDVVLLASLVLVGTVLVFSTAPGPPAFSGAAAAFFPVLYIGLPLGALAAVRTMGGREAVLLLMCTIVVSDSAQYYTGRAFGRAPLAPAISPKKTREGAAGGVVFGTLGMVAGGLWLFPGAHSGLLAAAAVAVVLAGIAGDLFESLLKRSAGVKDSSALIPGHGGILDRIDSWLFAAPVYYVLVRYLQA